MNDEENFKLIINISDDETLSKKLLLKIIEAHFKTVFVGAVFHIEEEFGELWGESDGFNEDNLTPEQRKWYEKFLSVRERIFTQGNRERKMAASKMNLFRVILDEDNGRNQIHTRRH